MRGHTTCRVGLDPSARDGRVVGMYLRTTERRNQDGSVVRYLQLAHNQRVDAATKAKVLLNLGREDRLDRDGLRRLVRSINRYLGEPDTGAGRCGGRRRPAGDRVAAGAAWLLDGLWRRSTSTPRCAKVLGPAPVHHRRGAGAVRAGGEPGHRPVLEAGRRRVGSSDVAIPGWTAMDDDQAYRAMDLLVEADAARAGAGGGVLRGRRPAQPRGRPAVLRHHQHLLRTRHPTEATTGSCGSAGTGTPRTTAPICRRSSSGWPSPARGSRCGCGAGRATPTTHGPARGPRRDARLAARPGRHRGGSRVLLATRTWTTCAAAAGTGSPGNGCATDARRRRRGAVPAGPLTSGQRPPARQGSPARLHPRRAVDHLPQPRRSRKDDHPRRGASPACEAELARIGDGPGQGQHRAEDRPPAQGPVPAGSRAGGAHAAPSARCVITSPSAAGCARPRPGGW